MSVAIHPSETRRSEPHRLGSGHAARLRTVAGLAGGGAALIAFAVGAFSFFSDLADPRARPVRVASVASQWPDLKDGVPALAPADASPDLRRASLPPEPAPAAAPLPPAPPAPVQASVPETPPPIRVNLPIEPAPTVPPAARTATIVAPAKVTLPLPPSRTETVRAKPEQPARFVSLPAPKAKEAVQAEHKREAKAATAKSDSAKSDSAKSDSAKPEAARKAVPPTRSRTAEAKPTQTASAQAPAAQPVHEASDEPELLGVKIPGGRQIREGWDSAVNGLFGSK